ncbi:uncharacterized protein LOC109596357 isoform X3 [Aethina tumida]|uniref:uncharacterized protein LOC109596357 isoform X3 n=1 Tax=Aethina tumida TaxID=116153 RepID=UPI0021490D16|nr:uncharacterized protein LOC109596357 isoform X3 [Aethina tumida]
MNETTVDKVEDEASKIKSFRTQQYENLTWSSSFEAQRRSREEKELRLKNGRCKLCGSFKKKIKESIFGTYLQCFNQGQTHNAFYNENKLIITKDEIVRMIREDKKKFEDKNSIFNGCLDIFYEKLKNCDKIDLDALFDIDNITLRRSNISEVDDWIKNFKNLRLLILSDNMIEAVHGCNLPRKLHYLELYENHIKSVKALTNNPPKKLLYLGLGCNRITTESDLHLLASSKQFRHLKVLDLCNNDIYNLKEVLCQLSQLKTLIALSLEGNPCSVVKSYKSMVLRIFPELNYLDNTQIMNEDKVYDDKCYANSTCAACFFESHRILGLPKPPKEKKKGVKQTFHFEVNLPLLEEAHEQEPDNPYVSEPTSSRDSSTSPKGKKGKNKFNPYKYPNEYNASMKKIKNYAFMTERKPWKANIYFDPIRIESPENDLRAMRDTFQSAVNVKLVYLRFSPPKKEVKGKKAKDKKDKKGKKGKKDKGSKVSKDETEEDKPPEIPEPPQEEILKRITLANFYCHLHYINWSDTTLDYYWALVPEASPIAIPVEGSLQ